MASLKIYVKAALFFVFLFLACVSWALFFLYGVVPSLTTGNYLLFLRGLVFLIMFVVFTFAGRKLEPAWEQVQSILGFKPKPKSTKEALKETAPTIALLIVALSVYAGIDWYFTLFPTSMSVDLAHEMLTSILTVDGILIGFNGVILAQLLWAIHSKGNLIYEQLISNRTHDDVVANLGEELNRLGRQRTVVIVGMFYAATPILASFLLCIMKLPLTATSFGNDAVSPRMVLYDPLAAMITGIILLATVSLLANLLPKKGRWPANVPNPT
jgi:hypothetical protein